MSVKFLCDCPNTFLYEKNVVRTLLVNRPVINGNNKEEVDSLIVLNLIKS